MSIVRSSFEFPVRTVESASRYSDSAGSSRRYRDGGGDFREAIAAAESGTPEAAESPSTAQGRWIQAARGQRSDSPAPSNAPPLANPSSSPEGWYMMPMQQSWTPPVVPDQSPAFPLDPVYRVPVVSQATLNRYIHPLQAVGAVAPNSVAAGEEYGTTVYRVAPGGLQDFVTSDGFRHRFDVEIVLPSPGSLTWQDRDATSIHPEVAEYAVAQMAARLEEAGLSTGDVEIVPFRMKGGSDARPWFFDQLILKKEGQQNLPISLNVAMRDPAYTLQTIEEIWGATAPDPTAPDPTEIAS